LAAGWELAAGGELAAGWGLAAGLALAAGWCWRLAAGRLGAGRLGAGRERLYPLANFEESDLRKGRSLAGPRHRSNVRPDLLGPHVAILPCTFENRLNPLTPPLLSFLQAQEKRIMSGCAACKAAWGATTYFGDCARCENAKVHVRLSLTDCKKSDLKHLEGVPSAPGSSAPRTFAPLVHCRCSDCLKGSPRHTHATTEDECARAHAETAAEIARQASCFESRGQWTCACSRCARASSSPEKDGCVTQHTQAWRSSPPKPAQCKKSWCEACLASSGRHTVA
jgi:hypothetical protein